MEKHPIEGLMETAMHEIKGMMDVNTIIGDPITSPDGSVIIPVSKVSVGFASGGSDFARKHPKDLFGGGSGAGLTINPIAFLVIRGGNVKLLQLSDTGTTAGQVVSAVPNVIEKISELFSKDKKNNKE